MRVTNNHHFCNGVTLDISPEGKLTWTIDTEKQKYKYGTVRVNAVDGTLVLNPHESLEEFCKLINIMFEFTGMDPSNLVISGVFDADSVRTHREKVLRTIYETPLDRPVQFVQLTTCGCNMGHCGEIVGVELQKDEPKTYDDLFKRFGPLSTNEDGLEYYEYPDSVWLCVEPVKSFPEFVHAEHSCFSEKIPYPLQQDPAVAYIAYSYFR
jgi:hypothetical protein